MKKIGPSKPSKDKREQAILLGLVELYLQTGKPVGSNTLRENGFENFSSATIRNYFARLESSGHLKQQHSSGGRIPTQQGYQFYVAACKEHTVLDKREKELVHKHLLKQTRELANYLSQAAEFLSEAAQTAVFISAPRFDKDFVLDIKLLAIDDRRCLCALMTDFGQVHTELLHTDKKLNNFSLKRLEGYFHWRIARLDKPKLTAEEEEIADRFYKELMLRHLVRYTYFPMEEIYKTGFSKLLATSDFNEIAELASGLSLFEDPIALQQLSQQCMKKGSLCCWIGNELVPFAPQTSSCSVIAVPYTIHQSIVGAIALLGPQRIPYKRLFGLLEEVAGCISQTLTQSIYKFKIAYRQPQVLPSRALPVLDHLLLEDQS